MSETPSTSGDPAISYLDEEIDGSSQGDLAYEIGNVLKRLFATDGGLTAHDAAHEIDAVYANIYFPLDPTLRFSEDKGMTAYLLTLHDFIFTLARTLRYDDTRQDVLVQLILEIRKLPPRAAKIWNVGQTAPECKLHISHVEDCILYEHDPIFNVRLDEDWNGYSAPDPIADEGDTRSTSDVQQQSDEYVFYSAFLARCTSAGLFENDKDGEGYKYSFFDIAKGLERDIPRGYVRKCRVLAAANFILLAGQAIRTYCQTYPPDSDRGKRARESWDSWEERFKEIADEADEAIETKDVARKAHTTMLELRALQPEAAEVAS